MSEELSVGMHIQAYSETGSVCNFLWRDLTWKSCTCSTGATGMGSLASGLATGLAATFAPGLAALLVEGLARGLVALGAGLAGVGRGGVGTTDIHAIGAQSCITTVPKLYVMVR